MLSGTLRMCRRFLKEEDGPTATEYAVMLALIIVVSIAALGVLGSSVDAVFNNLSTNVGNAAGV